MKFYLLLVVLFIASSPSKSVVWNTNSTGVVWQSTGTYNVDVPEFKKLLSDSNVILLDVRTPNEYTEGHLAESKNIDFKDPDFKSDLNKLDKDKKVLVYCRSGRRSGLAMELMSEMGFKSVYNLNGGIVAWTQAKMPIKK